MIQREVELDSPEEADNALGVGWKLPAVMEENVGAVQNLSIHLLKKRDHLDAECTTDKVQHVAANCHVAKSRIRTNMGRTIRSCAKSKRWWDSNIQDSVRNGPGRAGSDVFRPGLRALYQAWPAALSAGFSREKPGRPASPSGPSDRSRFMSAAGTHTFKMS